MTNKKMFYMHFCLLNESVPLAVRRELFLQVVGLLIARMS
jgi:hypothetical protein